ncbi:NADPH-dependent FMN reductase [Paenibacillus sp. S-38]|uniref:NADPH-dependent FMN reductase n=1 Tax=Paenibacillus sp. S-38 TaxID=3416710 RepID=UPI003CEB4BDC
MSKASPLTVLALAGSLRSRSSNTKLLQSAAALAPSAVRLSFYEDLALLPHFNPDLDEGEPHEAVLAFRTRLQAADGVIICTPEYARGVPGFLKNALDWIVSSGELVNKPVAVISASPFESGGEVAHASLLLTLGMMTAKLDEAMNLTVPFVNKKFTGEELTDDETRGRLELLLRTLAGHAEKGRS